MAGDQFSSGHPMLRAVAVLFFVGVLAIAAQGFFRAGSVPSIKIEPAMPVIGKKTLVKIELAEPRRGLTHVSVDLLQNGKSVRLREKSYPFASQFTFWGVKTQKDVLLVEAGRQTFPGLSGGTATIRVTAERAGTWMRSPEPKVDELVLPVRLMPPSLQVVSTQTYVSQGGCETVVYRVGETSVRDGVRAGAWWFPGFPLPGGGKQDRFALFAVPYDMNQPNVRLVAEDAAGNAAEMGFIDMFTLKPFRSDDMQISDGFMNKVVPEIMSQSPDFKDRGTLLENYLAINRELRKSNADLIKSLANNSKTSFLWTQPFATIPNGQVMAHFADRRNYKYQGQVVDHQDHLGWDLAVTKQAAVPAANAGVIAYAKYLGIYGNAVIIDHGFGLMTIYAHLSSISVQEGQKVAKGDIIGRTGETGLAGGDHLHFSTLLQGLPVNPSEWTDSHWIQDRLAKKLGPSFAYTGVGPGQIK